MPVPAQAAVASVGPEASSSRPPHSPASFASDAGAASTSATLNQRAQPDSGEGSLPLRVLTRPDKAPEPPQQPDHPAASPRVTTGLWHPRHLAPDQIGAWPKQRAEQQQQQEPSGLPSPAAAAAPGIQGTKASSSAAAAAPAAPVELSDVAVDRIAAAVADRMAGHHKRMVSHINTGQRELQRAMRVDLQAEGHRLETASDNQVCHAAPNHTFQPKYQLA